MESEILNKLDRIEKLILDQNLLRKEVLNLEEASQYLDVSKSHLYKLTANSEIPHYCPHGKKLYFKTEELNQWLLKNRRQTKEEIEQLAINYVTKHKLKHL